MMIFSILFFAGLFFMFVFILFGQEKLSKQVRQELAEQRALVAALEQRLASLAPSVNGDEGEKMAPSKEDKAATSNQTAPLSQLSFQGLQPVSSPEPQNGSMSMPSGAQNASTGGLDLFMAPPQR